MNGSTVTTQDALLEATATRFRRVFGDVGLGSEMTEIQEGLAPKARHETFRSRLEPQSPLELLRSNPPAAIERRLRRLGIRDDVVQEAVQQGAALEGRFDSGNVGLERIIGRNELLAIRYLEAGQRAGRAVGRVVVRSSSGATLGFGTGSMISPTLLMTNNHVLESASRAGNSVIEFNYQLGLDGRKLTQITFRLRPDLFFATSPQTELDVSIVGVAPQSESATVTGLESFAFNPLSADRDEILAGESVTIIQHPSGELKQIALRENRVLRFPNTGDQFLYYETDTSPGSSGAPVFNDQWEVISLHHSGFPERDSQGRILTPEGQIWRSEMGDERIHWIANEGIRVAAIRDFLASTRNLSSAQGALRDRALNPQPIPPLSQPDERQSGPNLVATQPSSDATPTASTVAATAVVNIPLTITVSVSSPQLVGATGGLRHDPQISTTPAPTDAPAQSRSDDPNDDDFEAAKKAFDEAATRPYFDAAADAADQTSYYANISSTLDPSQLFDSLSDLVSRTHTTKLGYKPMVHLYPWVDLQPDLKIRSIYSSQVFDAEEFIARDFAVARARSERFERYQTTESNASPTLEAAFFESLEAQFPYNCEHVVPQSWFQKKAPMKGDLHHLFACESTCNGFRGNTPYFDFADFREAIRSDCGKSETNKFEPGGGKGPVARATLYFLLRYPGKINATANEYTAERLQILLQWHKNNPVSDYEQHRNQAIFEVQGNRNPLIDHPDWAALIRFTRGLG